MGVDNEEFCPSDGHEYAAVVDDRTPNPHVCERCGARRFRITLTTEVHASAGMRWKGFLANGVKWSQKKRPFVEGQSEPSLTRDTGRWAWRMKVENRRENTYYEKVTDIESGDVLREASGTLTEHQGRGSAKNA